MSGFEDNLFNMAKKAVLEIPKSVLQDIYALSFYYWANSDDPRKPMLTISYNTNARWEFCIPEPGQKPKWPVASDSDEAKWNYAFWLQNEGKIGVFGESDSDFNEAVEWIQSLGLWYSDQEESEDFDKTLELGSKAFTLFREMCSRTALRLHNEGVIIGKFKRQIPVFVHELEYYQVPCNAIKNANPPGLADEFLSWIDALG